jgi:predicted RNA binding protein YcfA (HicA-like mRNA interferase family)
VPAARAIRAFQRAGHAVARTSGSHVILEHEHRKTIVIPRYGVVKSGLLLARVKDAGLTPDEFAALL